MSGTEPGIAEIVTEVLDEHGRQYWCAGHMEAHAFDDWTAHVGRLVAERLQAAEVGACGAAGGEAGRNASDAVSGTQGRYEEFVSMMERFIDERRADVGFKDEFAKWIDEALTRRARTLLARKGREGHL